MKAPLFLLLVCLFLLSPFQSALGQPVRPEDRTYSQNKKYSVEIPEGDPKNATLTIFSHHDGAPKVYWSHPLAVKKENEDDSDFSIFSQGAGNLRVLVANDGSAILMLPLYGSNDELLRVITKKGADKILFVGDVEKLFGATVDSQFRGSLPILDFLLESETPPVYAFWIADAKRWSALNLETATLEKPSAQLEKRLDSLGLARAREIVRKEQPNNAKSVIATLKSKANEIIPGVAGEQTGPVNESIFEAACLFLAARKNPEDKQLITRLLESKLDIFWGGPEEEQEFGLHSSERALGDKLLAQWEQKDVEEDSGDESQMPGSEKLNYLGSIAGTIYLPFAAPEKSGSLWIYLIPARIPEGAWQKEPSVVSSSAQVNKRPMMGPGMMPPGTKIEPEPIDHFRFRLDTLQPGEYRVKSVWDKRPPHAVEHGEKSMAIPSPGDYESAESPVIKIAAGQRVTGIMVECTNRVGKAEEYFAADDLWKASHPAVKGQSLEWKSQFGHYEPPKILFTAPIKDWTLSTNENKAGLNLKSLRLIERADYQTRQPVKMLAIKFWAQPPAKRNESRMFTGRLKDEHGCKFQTMESSSSRSVYELGFKIVPYNSKTFTISIIEQNLDNVAGHPTEMVAAAYTFTNLFKATPADWKTDALPRKQKLDLVTVELARFNPAAMLMEGFIPGAEFSPPRQSQNEFRFYSKDKEEPSWYIYSSRFLDRWGNQGSSLAEFCNQEEVFKLSADFARAFENGEFMPEEKWELPVKKVPGAGESIAINATNNVQGAYLHLYALSGTGEFTYKKGELISATSQVTGAAPVQRPQMMARGGRRPIQPKLYVKQSAGQNFNWFPGGSAYARPIVIASKIPHLVCYVGELGTDKLFSLQEQDSSVAEAFDALADGRFGYSHFAGPRNYPLQFLPLDFRPGETDKKLTLIVQKTRHAEFIVKVPSEQRPVREE